ncbi:MAG: AEC family transporter [Mogibacterium sp.]|nr:AEC family transporter [Mogibacterium sp.]MBR3330980.1 AEC family transporter [Mogibacterium sp.]
MLQNFIICVNAVIPSAIYLIIGIILKVTGVMKDEEVKKFTHVVFLTLYPFIMFDNLYGKNIADNMDVKLGLYAVVFTALQFIASWIFVCIIEKSNYQRGAMIQALYRSNYVLMGFPIAVNLFGKGNITAVAIIMMLVVPFYNISAVILFETFRGGKVNFGQMLKRILTNPIIDGGIAAFIVMMLGIDLPQPIVNTVGTLSDATAPIAMILLGAALNLKGFSSDRWRIAVCTIGKLVVFPAFGITGAVLLGIRDVQLIAVTLMSAAPVALASYAMASSMGGNGKLAGELVVITTITSCFTIPVFLFILKTNGLF